ncbi:phage baseplate assembly protein V [Candidatus Williamhamiltonella defendens]|uniref:phage baseplate assembly protein V n=1 Tax=Candidatus Williamhamiltonella defendens TaxID=138072 RepID=UPI001581678D|nr:phage baseplate assembly protein V [Candidatus Hamiltonella defensa]
MINHILQRLAEVERRLSNIFFIGTITDADYHNALVKVEAGPLETGWLHWMTARASHDVDYWAPEIGEQVLLLCPDGEPELGVVLPALYQNPFPATDNRPTVRRTRFADGADLSYDREAHAFKIMLPEGATTALISQGGISIVGDVHVTGHIRATEDITDHTRSMQEDRDIYNGHTHRSPETGAETSTPGAPQ